MRQNGLRAILAILLILYCTFVAIDVLIQPAGHAGDFSAYYFAGRAYLAGTDPYSVEAQSGQAGTAVGLAYVYNPITLPIVSLLARLDYETAFRVFQSLKIGSLVFLSLLWSKRFLDPHADRLAFFYLCAFGFGGAIYQDLVHGNISIFEQVGLWIAFDALFRRRYTLFTLVIVVIGLVKLIPLFFLLAPVLLDGRRGLRYALLGGGIFLALNTIWYVSHSAEYASFVDVTVLKDERGPTNPAMLALVRDLADILARRQVVAIPLTGQYGVFILISLGILSATVIAIQRQKDRSVRETLFLLCFAYAISAPRFKHYSYILLLLPAYFTILRGVTGSEKVPLILLLSLTISPGIPFGLDDAVRNLFWSYYPLISGILLWVTAMSQWRRQRDWLEQPKSSPA